MLIAARSGFFDTENAALWDCACPESGVSGNHIEGSGRISKGGDTVSTEAVASRRHAGGQPPVTGWKLELPTTTWHLLLN